jgi:hypothetical protein
MYAQFRNLVLEALHLDEQWRDLGERLQTGTPSPAGEETFRELGERRRVLLSRIGDEAPAALIASWSGTPAFAFTEGAVPVEPREQAGEQLIGWLRDHADRMSTFLRATRGG